MTLDCIVVGIDGSANAQRALAWAITLAEPTGARVVAVHALGLLDRLGGTPVPTAANRSDIESEFRDQWCAALDTAGVASERIAANGSPADVILAVAVAERADLVVVGERGTSTTPTRMLGSTSHRVLAGCDVPVLVVPEPRRCLSPRRRRPPHSRAGSRTGGSPTSSSPTAASCTCDRARSVTATPSSTSTRACRITPATCDSAAPTSSNRAGELESAATVDLDHHFSVGRGARRPDRGRGRVLPRRRRARRGGVRGGRQPAGSRARHDHARILAAAAREQGIHRFIAWVMASNSRMLRVFRTAGFEIQKTTGAGSVEITFDIEPTPGSVSAQQAREHAAEAQSIARLLCPKSIAGDRRQPSTGLDRSCRVPQSHRRRVRGSGVSGEPARPVRWPGVKAYPSVTDIPDQVDLAVILTPASTAIDVVQDCAAKGVAGWW